MRLKRFLAAVLAVATPAYAAAPPSQPAYQINLGIGPSSPSFAYGSVPMWIDTTNTTVSPIGLPRPTSTEYPLPMACITGCGGSGSSTPTGAAGSPNAAVVSTQGVQGGTPTPVSGSVTVGNLPATQPVSATALPLPGGAATSANQPALNADGGALAHVSNFPPTQATTDPATAALQASNAGSGITVKPANGVGAEVSTVQPTLLTLLDTYTVTNAGEYYVQNQSAGTLQVVFDDGAGTAGTVSVQLLGPGASANTQGGDTSPPMAWFVGRVRVYGAAGAQHMARHN